MSLHLSSLFKDKKSVIKAAFYLVDQDVSAPTMLNALLDVLDILQTQALLSSSYRLLKFLISTS